MILHEAIELVLHETGRPMASTEIAQIINKRKLYSRQDNLPVPASQISARVNNYSKIFTKESGKIKLVQDDIVSLKLQRYKNELWQRSNGSNDVKIILETLKDLVGEADGENRELDIGGVK